MNRVTFSVLVLLAGACSGCAQQASRRTAATRMTVEDVVRLSKAGVSDEIILSQLQAKHASFDMSADQLVLLKTNSVSDRVIRAMMQMDSAAAPAPVHSPVIATKNVTPSVDRTRWVSHNDPMGFSVNTPADWNLRTDRQTGRINIQGPQGQQAVIWPMSVRQQLEARGAGAVVQQLARRVDPKLAWETPKVTGNTARVFARGQNDGAALIRWSTSPVGTGIFLFCGTAPSSVYPTSVDTFAAIFQSFQVLTDPKLANIPPEAPAKAAPPVETVAWTRWTDPREGAFSASVPQGWNVSGGAFRHSATDIRQSLILLSPDRQIRIVVGDPNIGAYTMPNQMYGFAGMREGSYTTLGDGSRLQIRRFLPAQQFIREYVAGAVARECAGLRVLSENNRQDLAGQAMQQARRQGAPNPRVSAAGVSFSCTWNGREARGYYAVATILPFPERGGIWYADYLYGYLAAAERSGQADDVSRHVLNSMGINAEWRQREDQIAGSAVAQDNARSQEIQARARQSIYDNQQKTSDTIVKGYEARSKVYDEISRKRENAILGTVDVIDPSSGQQYKIDNYSDYHWMNNQGVIAGTKTDTSPGVDWREMITLP